MPTKMQIVLLLVAIWAAVFVGSYVLSTAIDGPRNIDTGFRRLDVLVRYQLVAFAVAIVSAVIGIVWRREVKRILWVGLVPLLVTGLLIVTLIGATLILNPRLRPEDAYQPPRPATAPADEAIQNQ